MRKPLAVGAVALLLTVAVGTGCGKKSAENDTGGTANQAAPTAGEPGRAGTVTEYTCPMHADIVREKPGKCPTCDMFLEPKVPEGTKVEWVCPMPEDNVKRDKPGKCPKCGMFLRAEIVEGAGDGAAGK